MRKLPRLLKRTIAKLRAIGWRATLARVFHKCATVLDRPAAIAPVSPVGLPPVGLPLTYEIILNGLRDRALAPVPSYGLQENDRLHFSWIVPFFSKGSGGHKNLFRFVKGLETLGHRCTIYIVAEYDLGLSGQEIRASIRDYFERIEAEVKIFDPKRTSLSSSLSSDVVVATSWITAYVSLMFSAHQKLYFVQDYEPLFFSSGSYWHLANNTYQFGFYHLTLGPWLTSLLRQQHQVEADFYDIVVDKSLYYPRQQISHPTIRSLSQTNNLKVCFYGRSITPRRCFEIVVMALYLFAQEVKDVTIACYGWNEIPALPFECTNLGSLEVEDLAELYSSFDICIAPSSTNLALVAHEVMACGCALVDLEVENTALNLKHLFNSYLVKPDPMSMYQGLLDLYQNRDRLQTLKAKSVQYVEQMPDWNDQIRTFEKLVKRKLYAA